MKNFIIPCFIIVQQAETLEDAIKQTAKCQAIKNSSILLVDDELPVVATDVDMSKEYPHSMTKIPELRSYFH
jgi:hypothetical protein